MQAQQVALENDMSCVVYDRAALENMGAGAIVAVGKGSERDPRMIHLSWKPAGESKGSIAFVGKGITFDTGGMNLKPTGGIEAMKFDMCGGAAVLGAMSVVPSLNLPYTVHGIIAAAENMPSGTAYRPGDVLHTMNGKTVEIISTDAEGRLVLADALTYTARLGVDSMIDLATLTGSSVVALGKQGTSVFSTDDALATDILAAANWNGELMWRMPLWDEYQGLLKGDYADLQEQRRTLRRCDLRGVVPARVRRRQVLGTSRHRRTGLERPGVRSRPQGRDWTCGANAAVDTAQSRRKIAVQQVKRPGLIRCVKTVNLREYTVCSRKFTGRQVAVRHRPRVEKLVSSRVDSAHALVEGHPTNPHRSTCGAAP